MSLARHYGATLRLAHALPAHAVLPEHDLAQVQAQDRMEDFLRIAPRVGIRYEPVLHRGPCDVAFFEMVKERDIDLVVIATHARRGLRGLLLGSVPRRSSSLCPALFCTSGLNW